MSAPAQAAPQLRRALGLWDLVLFNLTAIVGLRWVATAARSGAYSLTLWVLALLMFFIPQGLAVVALSTRYPEEGGIYDWTKRAFGNFHGFFCGWCYWVSNLSYFPSLLIAGIGAGVYIGGPQHLALAQDSWFVGSVALLMLALVVALNVAGTEKGKWLQNIGGLATWVPGMLLVGLGALAYWRLGSATSFHSAALVPHFQIGTLSFWSTQAFAYAGLELGPIMAGEIRDPRRTVPRAVLISGIFIALIYIAGTAALLVAIPASEVNIVTGAVQAIDATARRQGLPPIAGVVGLLIALASLGGAGAWLAGSARLPFVAGLDRYLPPAFGRVHPRWQTPHVAILTQAGLAALLLLIGLPGGTVAEAYLLLQEMTVLLYFVPFLYLFIAVMALSAGWRGRGSEPLPAGAIPVPGGRLGAYFVGGLGTLTTALALMLALVPAEEVTKPLIYEMKLVGGTLFFFAIGAGLYWKGRNKAKGKTQSAKGKSDAGA